MGKRAPTPPPAPDPVAIAGAQGAANLDTAIGSQVLNQVGQTSPYGSVSYARTGSYTTPSGTVVPSFTQNVTLSPTQQAILNQTQGLQQQALGAGGKAITNVANTIGTPFSLSGLPALQSDVNAGNKIKTGFDNPSQQMSLGINDFSADRQKVQDALMSRFNTDWDKQQASKIANLNAQGIQSGSEGYGTEIDQLNRARNDALMQSILGAGAEQQRMFEMTKGAGEFANQAAAQQFAQNQGLAAFGNAAANQQFSQGLANAQLGNQARQQGVSEQALLRSQPINEFATLFGLGGGVQVPQGATQSGVGINPADILGANALQYNVLMNNYNAQMANRAAGMGALGNIFGTLGAAKIMSDIRSKTIHKRIGRTDSGFPLYLFTYRGDDKPQVGVIAQEVQAVMPDAVHDIGGMLHVDYGRL